MPLKRLCRAFGFRWRRSSSPIHCFCWSGGFCCANIRKSPEMAKSGVRRWLSFLSLFVGAVTIVADAITVVFHLVEGDLTVRFLLKVLGLFVITVRAVHLSRTDAALRRGGQEVSSRTHAGFAIVASVIVAFAVAWGFVVVGSPSMRRLERFDEQRLRDLQTIAREIQSMVVDTEQKRNAQGIAPKGARRGGPKGAR